MRDSNWEASSQAVCLRTTKIGSLAMVRRVSRDALVYRVVGSLARIFVRLSGTSPSLYSGKLKPLTLQVARSEYGYLGWAPIGRA